MISFFSRFQPLNLNRKDVTMFSVQSSLEQNQQHSLGYITEIRHIIFCVVKVPKMQEGQGVRYQILNHSLLYQTKNYLHRRGKRERRFQLYQEMV